MGTYRRGHWIYRSLYVISVPTRKCPLQRDVGQTLDKMIQPVYASQLMSLTMVVLAQGAHEQSIHSDKNEVMHELNCLHFFPLNQVSSRDQYWVLIRVLSLNETNQSLGSKLITLESMGKCSMGKIDEQNYRSRVRLDPECSVKCLWTSIIALGLAAMKAVKTSH